MNRGLEDISHLYLSGVEAPAEKVQKQVEPQGLRTALACICNNAQPPVAGYSFMAHLGRVLLSLGKKLVLVNLTDRNRFNLLVSNKLTSIFQEKHLFVLHREDLLQSTPDQGISEFFDSGGFNDFSETCTLFFLDSFDFLNSCPNALYLVLSNDHDHTVEKVRKNPMLYESSIGITISNGETTTPPLTPGQQLTVAQKDLNRVVPLCAAPSSANNQLHQLDQLIHHLTARIEIQSCLLSFESLLGIATPNTGSTHTAL